MYSVMLSALARRLGVSPVATDIGLTGLAIDSRQVKPGDLFAAIKGDVVDGHDFIDDAITNGARAVISDRAVKQSIPSLQVPNVERACGEFGALMRRIGLVKIVGITGSAGKTTAKSYVEEMCSRAGETVATLGNQNNELGVPLTLSRLSSGPDFGVIEMGAAQQGDIAYLAGLVQPDIVVLLNAFEAHLGRFGSVKAIVETKGEILDGLSPESVAVLNADQSYFDEWKRRAQPASVISFGMSDAADIQCVAIKESDFSGSTLTLTIFDAKYTVRLAIPGKAGVMNALAAVAVGVGLGIDEGDIIAAVETLEPVGRRGNVVPLPRGVRLIDDSYNASPSSVMAAISLLATVGSPRTAVLGDMLELGDASVDYHREVGRHVQACGIERLLCVGDLARHFIVGDEAEAQHFSDVDALIGSAPAFSENETVLVKGSRGVALDRFVDEVYSSLGGTQC